MAEAMQTTGKAMAKMNKAVNVSTISKMMVEFEKENAKAEMMQEVMGDAIDDAMEGEDAEEEEDRIVGQLLDEIGITFGEELPEAAGMRLPAAAEPEGPAKVATAAGGGGGGGGGANGDPALSDLEARLNNLKR
jgi:charged multivesicular body protein 2A